MDQNRFLFFRRTLCAVCAFALVLSLTAPAAHAANEAVPAGTELTQAQAAAMAEADAAVSELLDSSGYAAMTVDERQAAAEAQLEQLAGEGLVQPGSIRYDEENGMVSFSYDCGVLGGILLTDWEDEPFVDLPLTMPEELPGPLDAENDVMPLGNAIIYYAFDDTVNSTRYPNYLTMQEAWNGWGLATTIDTDVTVADLRHMDDYDLCVLSTHGAYYTYTTGWLFKQVRTAPVLLLREESSFWDDLRYGFDLLTHRVIKVNGDYCITPDFFAAAYRGGRLEGTMVFSETCEFFGGSNILDLSMSNARGAGGGRLCKQRLRRLLPQYAVGHRQPADHGQKHFAGGGRRRCCLRPRRHLLVFVAGRRQAPPVRGFCPGPRGRHRHPLHHRRERGGVTIALFPNLYYT